MMGIGGYAVYDGLQRVGQQWQSEAKGVESGYVKNITGK
jgi:hypothetical protein